MRERIARAMAKIQGLDPDLMVLAMLGEPVRRNGFSIFQVRDPVPQWWLFIEAAEDALSAFVAEGLEIVEKEF